MIFGDIIALAKQGYKPADIKELLALSTEDAAPAEKPAETPAEESGQPEPEKAPEAAAPKTVKEDNNNEDLQKQISDLKKQLEKTQEDLEIAQKANRSGSEKASDQKTAEDALADLVRSYM